MIYLIAFAAVFGALDRLWGSDVKIMGRSGHSLASVGTLITAVAAYWLINQFAGAMCMFWLLYRSIGFSGGAMAPQNVTEAVSAFGRHLIAAGLLLAILGVRSQALTVFMYYPLAYAIVATGLAIFNGETEGRANWAVEGARGACFGACAALSLELV